MNKRVVITGTGNVCVLGHHWSEIKASLLNCKNGVRYMTEWDAYPDLQTRLAAPVDHFAMPEHYGPKKKRGMGRVAQMAVAATEYALADAQLAGHPIIKSGQTGVAYGSATGSSEAAMEFFNLLDNKTTQSISGTTYLRMMSHSAAVNISVLFGTSGRMYTTTSACTAGSQGIGYAYEAIRAGQQTVMLAGGAEELCPTQAAVFDSVYSASLKNSEPEKSPRPFDRARDGLVLGEGASTLVLEERDFALSRGANILAEIVGFATNCDGTHLVRPNKKTMTKVMALALNDAQLTPQDIGYISGHGTATIHGDIAESHATYDLFGADTPFSTLKGYLGHSLGACGALEASAAIRMMNEGWFNPTVNLDDIDPRCAALDYIQHQARDVNTNIMMSNNFAFGGVNTSLIFKRHKS